MKKGIIIYRKDDSLKNDFFINKCLSQLNDSHFQLQFVVEDVALYLKNQYVDFAIYRGRDYRTIEKLNHLGLKVFNNSLTNKIANNKYLTYQLFNELNLPCITTYLDSESLSFPYIMKSVDGHGGQEVFLIDKLDKKQLILAKYPHKTFIYQPFTSNTGDVRLYLLNKKFVKAVKRENQNDFRNNYSLGGQASLYTPNSQIIEQAEWLARYLEADYIGIDLLLTEESYAFNEIEDPVGSRMLYEISDIDIIALYITHIKKQLEQ